jgi:cobalt-zinc-cadmium efflux system protein
MAHDHAHSHAGQRGLRITLGLVCAYMVAEVVGGLVSGSLALLADAGHMLSDAAALGLALFAMRMARKPATAEKTYGYYRAEILAALVNGAALLVISVFILIEAWERFQAPSPVRAPLMIAVAAGGLAVNLVGLRVLSGERDRSLNLRGAWLHVLTDALGSVQALVAGVLIAWLGWLWVDALASVLIALLVAWSSWTLLRESVTVLMEGSPAHIDVAAVRSALMDHPEVVEVHDLHVWTITSGLESLSAHVVVEREPTADLLATLRETLLARFGLEHVTLQIECTSCEVPCLAS